MTVRVVRGRIVVLVAEDNLVRGASGVAVQNFNRMYRVGREDGVMLAELQSATECQSQVAGASG